MVCGDVAITSCAQRWPVFLLLLFWRFSFSLLVVLFFFSVLLPHLQWLCYQGSQAKGWSNHNFRAGLGRNKEVTKLRLSWQRNIQEHRMPLLWKNRSNKAQHSPSISDSFFHPSPSISLSLHLLSPTLSISLSFFFRQSEACGGWGWGCSSSLSLPLFSTTAFVSPHIQNNKFTIGHICIFLGFMFGEGPVSFSFLWVCFLSLKFIIFLTSSAQTHLFLRPETLSETGFQRVLPLISIMQGCQSCKKLINYSKGFNFVMKKLDFVWHRCLF